MIESLWLGRRTYAEIWELQRQLVAERDQMSRPDCLLLVEHEPVYTFGRRGQEAHLLLDEAARQAQGIELFWVDRGGDITYHGPGQLVGYPILNLKRYYGPRPDLHQYLRDLEAVLIQACASLGVAAWRFPGYTGVWVAGPAKIGAIGVKVSGRYTSSHGFALNVCPNLAHFGGIVPCGIQEYGVTSLQQLLTRPVSVAELIRPVQTAFHQTFQPIATPPVSTYNSAL